MENGSQVSLSWDLIFLKEKVLSMPIHLKKFKSSKVHLHSFVIQSYAIEIFYKHFLKGLH